MKTRNYVSLIQPELSHLEKFARVCTLSAYGVPSSTEEQDVQNSIDIQVLASLSENIKNGQYNISIAPASNGIELAVGIDNRNPTKRRSYPRLITANIGSGLIRLKITGNYDVDVYQNLQTVPFDTREEMLRRAGRFSIDQFLKYRFSLR